MTAEETARKENRVVHSIVDSDTPPSCWFQVSETTYRRLSRDGYFRTPRSTKEEIAHAVSIDNGIISWSFYWFLHFFFFRVSFTSALEDSYCGLSAQLHPDIRRPASIRIPAGRGRAEKSHSGDL